MKKFKVAIVACLMLALVMNGTTVFASDNGNISTESRELESTTIIVDLGGVDTITPQAQRGIYSKDTLVYTGKGVDRWLHFKPKLSNSFYIKMIGYKNNVLWEESVFVPAGTAIHRFVGKDVYKVYLAGIPGGIVEISDTAH